MNEISETSYDYYYSPRQGKIIVKNVAEYNKLKFIYGILSSKRFPETTSIDECLSKHIKIENLDDNSN